MMIKGSVALITGGAQGLGKGFARALLQRGGKVAVVDICKSKGDEFLSEVGSEAKTNCMFIHCDVTNATELKDAFATAKNKFGKLNIISNNAGAFALDAKDHPKVIALNLTSVIQGTEEGIKHLSKKNGGEGGVIINTASMAAIHPLRKSGGVYTATKAGVLGYSRTFKGDLKEDGIRVNCICPSFAVTPLLENAMKASGSKFQQFIKTVGLVPVEQVVDGFLRFVEDDTLDGDVMTVTAGDGIAILSFPKIPYSKTITGPSKL